MIAAALRAAFRRFGKRYDYDPAYLIDVVDESPMAGLRLAVGSTLLSQEFGLPRTAYFAAKARSTLRADCGSCLRLVVDMAAEKGVSTDNLLPVFGRGIAVPDVALAIAFTDAVLDNRPDLIEIGVEVDRQFGRSGRIGLATAVIAGQFFPIYKSALGHATACEPVLNDILANAHAREGGHASEQ